jgi:hypothetical protein
MRIGAPPPISTILTELVAEAGERISLGEMAERMRGHAFGMILLVFALPETIPMVGFSLILAVPIGLVGAYMVVHGQEVKLPGWIRRRSIKRRHLEAAVVRMLPLVRWAERVSRRRWPRLASACRFQGAVTVAMSVVLALPIPGLNLLAAAAVFGIGLGMILRDGRIIALAFASAALATAGMAAVLLGVVVLAT